METSNNYKTVEPEEFSKVVSSSGVNVLDVRTKDEYDSGHIKGAKNLDVTSPDFIKEAEEMLPKDVPLAVYCRTGKKSTMASNMLSEDGYNIINLDGGITAWEAAGLPITK